jgi:AraC-like DNA-binding protein
MIETPYPDLDGVVPGPAGNDVLSDALRVFRVTGAALLRGEFKAPWAWDSPPASMIAAALHPGATRLMLMHIVTEGSCWVELDGMPRRPLPQGSIVGFPQGSAHRMGAGDGSRSVPVTDLMPSPPWTELPVLHHGEQGDLTRLVCVYLRCDDLPFNPILSSLPPALVVLPDENPVSRWIEASVPCFVAEASSGRPGCGYMLSRLTELLFMEILRGHIARLHGGSTGWLAALGDRYLARTLAAIHAHPQRAWTVLELARLSGLSRTALVERFHRVLGSTPMRYVAMWRLQLAAQALLGTDKGVAMIAEDAGYGSEEAFSRAFKRHTAASPGQWRSARRRPPGTA